MTKQTLPDCPEMAIVVGGLYSALGASLHIDQTGKKLSIRPEPYVFTDAGLPLPSLPDAEPYETFLDRGEYRGAIKVLEFVLARLGKADRELIFGILANESGGGAEPFDFREQLS